jgi:citrate lyase subunit beta / citryl-CoA lyase
VHPDQVAPVNAAYRPIDSELARAERIVAAFKAAEARGEAAVQVDGEMVDYPVAYRAQALLDSMRGSR